MGTKSRYYTICWDGKNGRDWGFYSGANRVLDKLMRLVQDGVIETIEDLENIIIYESDQSYTLVRSDWSLSPKAYYKGDNKIGLMWGYGTDEQFRDWEFFDTMDEVDKKLEELKEKGFIPASILIYSQEMKPKTLKISLDKLLS